MKHSRSEESAPETHVFDQTNGIVDLGESEPSADGAAQGRPDIQITTGMAMLSTQRP